MEIIEGKMLSFGVCCEDCGGWGGGGWRGGGVEGRNASKERGRWLTVHGSHCSCL